MTMNLVVYFVAVLGAASQTACVLMSLCLLACLAFKKSTLKSP